MSTLADKRMTVLDIDLDFFLDGVVHFVSSTEKKRIEEGYVRPWEAKAVIRFIESQCGLSPRRKILGRIIRNHHQAFYFWKELIESSKLAPPFSVTHIDAHADLGLGDASWVYIMQNILHRKISQRSHPARSGDRRIDIGNYLSFAIACRWLSSLTFVHHGKEPRDLAWIHFKDYNHKSGYIQLKKYPREAHLSVEYIRNTPPVELEPAIPFSSIPYEKFKNENLVKYVVLCQSPNYTPKSSDKLIDIIKNYIEII